MKTVGESLFTFAIHAAAIQRDLVGLVPFSVTYSPSSPGERAEVITDLLTAIEAGPREGEGQLLPVAGGAEIHWLHEPKEGDPYAVRVRIK